MVMSKKYPKSCPILRTPALLPAMTHTYFFRLQPGDLVQRFQNGELLEKDQEWHKLVPPEAQEAVGKDEVQRQSVIFELIKAERDYVSDLEAIKDVGLFLSVTSILNTNALPGFH
jgi:hypothetical protein